MNILKVVVVKVEILSFRYVFGLVSIGEVNVKNLEKNMEEVVY